MPTRPSKHTANILWGSCGNECANPDCSESVLRIDKTTKEIEKLGEIAHIKGAKPNSNRYDANQTDEQRHGYDNLLILCKKCHREQPDGVDIPQNEFRFSHKLLTEWKTSHIDKLEQLNDRNWICFPNSAHLFNDGVSTSVKYWIDQQGRAQLYNAEQLAIVDQLFPLTSSFSQINSMLKQIEGTQGKPIDPSHQTMNDAVIGSLYSELQRVAKKDEYGWIGYLSETMMIAQDVTLGELQAMMVKDGLKNKESLRKQGVELLKEKSSNTDPLPKYTKVEPSQP